MLQAACILYILYRMQLYIIYFVLEAARGLRSGGAGSQD